MTRVWARTTPTYLAVFLIRSSFGLVVFSLPRAYPRLTNLQLGAVAAAYPVTEMLTVLFFGILADRVGRKPVLTTGLLVSSAAIMMFTFTQKFGHLLLIHGLQGLAAAMIVASSLALVADYTTERVRGREMGFYDFATVGGYIVGPSGAGLLEHLFSPMSPFYVATFIAFAGAIIGHLTIVEPPKISMPGSARTIRTLRSLLGSRRAVAMFPIWLVVTTFLGIGLTFGPRLVESPLRAGGAFAGVALVLALSQPFFGSLSDRYGREKLMLVGTSSLLGLFTTIVAIVRFNVSLSQAAPLLTIFGLGSFSFAPAALATLADVAPDYGRGTTMGAYSLVMSLGTIIGPLLAGWVLDNYDLPALLYLGVILLVTAVTITIVISRLPMNLGKRSKGL